MAKRKKKKNKKQPQQIVKVKPANYIRQHARKSPIYECLIDENWRETQFSPIIVSRQKASGRIIIATYIVDMQCLGVKDTVYNHDMEIYEYKDFVSDTVARMNLNFVKIDPMLCFNIIYGAVEFAEDCGFPPHKDFAISEYLLADVESIDYIEVPLGKDGKPYFVAGPFDDAEKIIAILRKNVGEGNFEFMGGITPDDFGLLEEDEGSYLHMPYFFPEAIIDKKIASFQSADQRAVIHLQLNIAATIMEAGNGDLVYIEEQYENDEGFFEDIFEDILMQLEESKEGEEELDMSLEEYDQFEEHTAWVLEKIIELDGPQFLWEEDYQPELVVPDIDTIKNFSEEEWQALEQKKLFYMTRAQKDRYLIGKILLGLLGDYTEEQLVSKELQEQVLEEFLEKLRTTVFENKWNDEIKDFCLSIGEETFEKLVK